MDLRKLKTLIDLVADASIAELEVSEGDSRVRIVKNVAPHTPQAYAPMPAPAASVAAPAPAADAEPPVVDGEVVKSPMVGTFYRAPGPDKPAYVDLGSVVKAADPVCIVEAMKLLNEIEAGFDGTIKEILVENGQPVEYGQPLFIVG